MPTLRELSAEFVRYEERMETWAVRNEDGSDGVRTGPRGYTIPVESIAEADGVQFLCPLCFVQNKGPSGTHMVKCWFVGRVGDSVNPLPGRWTPQGTGIDDLTFIPGNPPRAISVQLLGGGCAWHGFVSAGSAA